MKWGLEANGSEKGGRRHSHLSRKRKLEQKLLTISQLQIFRMTSQHKNM
jgi:hypothetical protein